MNKYVAGGLAVLAGVAGAAASYIFCTKKHESEKQSIREELYKLLDEKSAEIDSLKKQIEEKKINEKKSSDILETEVKKEDTPKTDKAIKEHYEVIAQKYKPTDEPEVIEIGEFEENENYETEVFNYYAEDILVDEEGFKEELPASIIGHYALKLLQDASNEEIYIRDDHNEKCYRVVNYVGDNYKE